MIKGIIVMKGDCVDTKSNLMKGGIRIIKIWNMTNNNYKMCHALPPICREDVIMYSLEVFVFS